MTAPTIIERAHEHEPRILSRTVDGWLAIHAKVVAACGVRHSSSCPYRDHAHVTEYGYDGTRTRLTAECVPHGCHVNYTVAEYKSDAERFAVAPTPEPPCTNADGHDYTDAAETWDRMRGMHRYLCVHCAHSISQDSGD